MRAEERAKIEPLFNCALEFWRGGDAHAAAEIFERLALEYPNRPYILGMLGAVYRDLGDYERAVDCFRRTLSLSPKSELASRALFFSLWDIGKHDEAIAEMERFLSVAKSKEYDLIVREMIEGLDA